MNVDEALLAEIEFEVGVGQTLPGRDAYTLRTLTLLVGEVRRLRAALQTYGLHTVECASWHADFAAAAEDGPCDCGFAEARR